MPLFVWICLGVFLVVLIPTVALAVVAGLRTLRAAGSLNRELEPRVARLQAQSEDLNRRSAQATYATDLAKARIASLQASLKRVDVFLWALEDVRAFQRAVKTYVPRK